MATARQIAANQKRSINTIKDRIEKLALGWEDVNGAMVFEAEKLMEAAELFEEQLNSLFDDKIIGDDAS